MRFSCSAGDLRDALSVVRGAIPGTPAQVAYSGVLIVVTADQVKLTGSDGETTVTSTVKATIGSPGQVLLQPKPLGSFLTTLNAGLNLEVKLDDSGDIEIEPAGLSAYKFRPLAATYPQPPATPGKPVTCTLDALSGALAAIRPSVSRDTLAVQVVSDDSGLVLHATDTFRLSRAEIAGAGFGKFTGVLPLPVLERVAKALPEKVTVDSKSRMVSFHAASMDVSTRLLAVPFPAVDAVLDNIPPSQVTFDPKALRVAIARLSSVADQAAVRIRLEGTSMTLSASTADIGAGSETIGLNNSVPAPFEVLAKAQYLAEAIGTFDTSSVSMAYSGPLQPLFLVSDEPFALTHVVMPVRS